MTVAIMIGNSDDKLGQAEWAQFCMEVSVMVQEKSDQLYFSGGSDSRAPFQNSCVVFLPKEEVTVDEIEDEMDRLRKHYKQDSVAMLVGTSYLVGIHETVDQAAK